jgi:hypothetical protein
MSSPSAGERSWGDWVFDPSNLSLVLNGQDLPPYTIQLRGITSSACMLDAIFGVKRKEWATNDVVCGLIAAFQDLFDPQVTLCGSGTDRKMDPTEHLRERHWVM